MPELTVRDLTIEYATGDYTIRPVEGLNLHAGAGSLVILLGPSGSGKTSLLSCLGGILTPASGSILVGETEVTALTGSALTSYRRNVVGIIFQAFNLVPSLTATENILVPLRAAGIPRADARVRARTLLDMVGLGDRRNHRPGKMSGGQQQRVAVARALGLDPPLLLADEPTAHLDYIQVEGILRLLRELASGDRMVVVSTHDDRLVPLADQVVELVPEFTDNNAPPKDLSIGAGEILFRQGERAELVFVLVSGEVDVVREHSDGSEELLATMHAGDYFGELGPFLGIPRSATARARSDAVLRGYNTRDFRREVGADKLPAILSKQRGTGTVS